MQLPDRLRGAQAAFAATGGLHATGLFTANGELLCAREDVGRHNAMDKVIGWAFGAGRLPLAETVLCVSGRLSFELVQKAAVAGLPGPRRRRRAVESRRVARSGSRHHALRLRARRQRQRLHRGVADRALTGVLLVGGASTRFGSPKALAQFGGETLAERAWRLLGEACDERIAVGKRADALDLPFELLDDGTEVRAPIAGVVAGLRAAAHEVAVVIPVDMPMLTAQALAELAAACRDAAVAPSGPLPGAYRRTALPALELALAENRLALRDAIAGLDVAVVYLDAPLLLNVNTAEDVQL